LEHWRYKEREADTEQRSEDRVGGEDGCGVEKIGVDEVVETTEEDKYHSATEWS
jgi:hypothetical protein